MGATDRPPARAGGDGCSFIVVLGICAASGVLVGVSGPPIVVGFAPGLVAGPTWTGLLILGAVALAALTFCITLVLLLLGQGVAGPGGVFLGSLVFVGGSLGGAWIGNELDVAGWAPRTAAVPTPSWSIPPIRTIYQANGRVTVETSDLPGFTAPALEPYGDGLFGHWCYSEPDVKVVSNIEALETGTIGAQHVSADLQLTDPGGDLARWSVAIPRLDLRIVDDRGRIAARWVGPVDTVASSPTHGRLSFRDLPMDEGEAGAGVPATISGTVDWACGVWRLP